MADNFYRLTLDQAKQIADDIINNLLTPAKLDSHNVVPTAPATELTLGSVKTTAAVPANSTNNYIITLLTDDTNTILEPDLAAITEAMLTLGTGNIIFRYVAL